MSANRFEAYQAAWVTFWAKPEAYRAPDYGQGMAVYLGQVVGVHVLPPAQPGNVPQADLTVRGRTKREMRINTLTNHVRIHRTFHEAEVALLAGGRGLKHEAEERTKATS